jgi:hypothetical protein
VINPEANPIRVTTRIQLSAHQKEGKMSIQVTDLTPEIEELEIAWGTDLKTGRCVISMYLPE